MPTLLEDRIYYLLHRMDRLRRALIAEAAKDRESCVQEYDQLEAELTQRFREHEEATGR